jgi:hypothetical protein
LRAALAVGGLDTQLGERQADTDGSVAPLERGLLSNSKNIRQ